MAKEISHYFESVEDPRVVGRCAHLLSDILLTAICTYITGGSDYQNMHLLAKERGTQLKEILQLPNGAPSADTFERVFKNLEVSSLKQCLELYGKDILSCLSDKQIVLDGKKAERCFFHRQRQQWSLYFERMGKREQYLYRSGKSGR